MGWQDLPVAPAQDASIGTSPATPAPTGWQSFPVAPTEPGASLSPASNGSVVAAAPYDATDAAMHGLTFGLSDAARAAMMAGSRYLRGQTPGFDYGQAATELKRGREAYENEYPLRSAAANLAGGFATAPLGISAAGNGGALMQALRGGLTAAGLGATEGASDNSTSLSDAIAGAKTGAAVGGAFGAALPLGRSLMPGLTAQAKALRSLGVEPTMGTAQGGFPAIAEDLFSKIPVLGAPVKAGRIAAREQLAHAADQQMQDFQRGAINQALARIGESLNSGTELGNPAIDEMVNKISTAYNAAVPAAGGALDPQASSEINGLLKNADMGLPTEQARLFKNFVATSIRDKMIGTTLPGQAFKDAESDLSGKIRGIYGGQNSSAERDLAGYYRDLQGSLRDWLARSNPAASAQIGAANQAWREALPIWDASASNLNGNFTPMQLGSSARKMAGRRAFGLGSAPMQSVAQSAEANRQNLTRLGANLPTAANAGGHIAGAGFTGGLLGADLIERMLEHPHGPALAAAAFGYPALAGLYSNAGRAAANNAISMGGRLMRGLAPLGPVLAPQVVTDSQGLLSVGR